MISMPCLSCQPCSRLGASGAEPEPEDAQRGDVGPRQQRLVLQQRGEQRGRRAGIGRAVLLDLPQERGQVERMMLHQQPAHLQPGQEHPVDAGHVHHRERVEQHVVRCQVRAFHRARAHGHPVVVGPRHALGRALRPRGPADRDAVVRVGGEAGQVRGQPGPVIGRRDPLVEPGPEHPHPLQRGDLRAQPGQLSRRGPLPYPVRRDEQLDLRHVGQVGELPGAVLHRERGHDRADPHDGQERDDDLDRVRQLDPDHVAGPGALRQQHLRQPGNLLVELRPGQRADRAVQQRLPVQRVGDRRDVAELPDPLAQQRVDHVVGPVALVAVLPDPLRRMQTHLSSLGR